MVEHSLYISVASIILSLIVFSLFIYSHYQKVIGKNTYIDALEKRLHALEKSISETTELLTLDPLLKKELPKIFGTNIAFLQMYSEGENPKYFPLLREFFQSYPSDGIFENSEDFSSEGEDEVLIKKLKQSLPNDIAYIFPILSTSGFHIGNLVMGAKTNGASYVQDEIEFLKEFTFFVEIHLKYIRTYTLMHEFSKILDEKVDNTTLAYNNLINRQKEFIQVISHEVRSPMTSAIFQVESAIESLEGKNFSREKTHQELEELRIQMVRTGGLISKLFSVEYYDNQNVTLFREAIHFPKFLEYEIELFSRVHTDVTFLSHIDPKIGFIAIDKVQFQQVISNLLDNAVKFAKSDDPVVFLSAKKGENSLLLTVEDNGKGFSKESMKAIFDKYNTATNKNIGLGLGLYLCRKIIDLHHGTIVPSNSEKYRGACFTIELPLLGKS